MAKSSDTKTQKRWVCCIWPIVATLILAGILIICAVRAFDGFGEVQGTSLEKFGESANGFLLMTPLYTAVAVGWMILTVVVLVLFVRRAIKTACLLRRIKTGCSLESEDYGCGGYVDICAAAAAQALLACITHLLSASQSWALFSYYTGALPYYTGSEVTTSFASGISSSALMAIGDFALFIACFACCAFCVYTHFFGLKEDKEEEPKEPC